MQEPKGKPCPEKDAKPHPVDVHVGGRIRHFRLLRKMTQADLSNQIGVKFQQLQKYETGFNRVSASRLYLIAEALDVEVADLFEMAETCIELSTVSLKSAAKLPDGEVPANQERCMEQTS